MESSDSLIVKEPGDILIISPLRVPVSAKKDFILNLNNYRNTHFRVLAKAKRVYTEMMLTGQLVGLQGFLQAEMFYRLYPKTRRRTDIGNVCSVHQKFFEDAMVKAHMIPDDDYKHILQNTQLPVLEVDKFDPRVEILIRPIEVKE
jgi:hypothetical protein